MYQYLIHEGKRNIQKRTASYHILEVLNHSEPRVTRIILTSTDIIWTQKKQRERNSAPAFEIRAELYVCVLYYICSTLDNLAGSCSSSTQYTYYVHTTTVQGRGRGRRNKGRHRNTLRAAELLGSDSAGLLPPLLLQLVHTFFVQQTDRDLSPSAKPTNERANLTELYALMYVIVLQCW